MKRIGLLLVLAGLTAQGGIPARVGSMNATTSASTRIEAHISGLADGGVYTDLPPVLVEFQHLSRTAEVWVEVREGAARSAERGTILDRSKMLRMSEGRAVLSVADLHKACDSDGTWSLMVLARNSLGVAPLAETTFELRRDLRDLDPASVRLDPVPAPGD